MRNCAAVQSAGRSTLRKPCKRHSPCISRIACARQKALARALKAAPDNFDALHLLGLDQGAKRPDGEAHWLMSTALKINPNVPDVLINFANVLHALARSRSTDCL